MRDRCISAVPSPPTSWNDAAVTRGLQSFQCPQQQGIPRCWSPDGVALKMDGHVCEDVAVGSMFRGWLHRKRSAPGGSRNGFLAAEALSPVSFRASPAHPGLFSPTICPHRLRCQWPGRIETFFFNCLDHRRERQRESTARIRAQREGGRSLAPWSWIKMERWIRMWLGAVVSLQLNIIGPRTSSQSWAERKNPTRWNFRPLGCDFDVLVCVFRVQSRVCVKSNIHLGTFAPINQHQPTSTSISLATNRRRCEVADRTPEQLRNGPFHWFPLQLVILCFKHGPWTRKDSIPGDSPWPRIPQPC